MIVDAHCHAWRRWPYTTAVPDPATRGDATQLLSVMDAHGVDRALVVAAGIGAGDARTDNTDNNDYVASAVRASGGRLDWVADVDSRWSSDYRRAGGADRVRAALGDRPDGPVGITHYCSDTVDDWFDTADGAAFLTAVGDRLLSVHLPAQWIPAFVPVARRHPGLTVLVHHQGHVRPDRPWDYPFVHERETLRRVVDHVGARRLVWGSDFPVSAADLSYRQTIEVVREHCDFLDPADLAAVLGGTLTGLLDRVTADGV